MNIKNQKISIWASLSFSYFLFEYYIYKKRKNNLKKQKKVTFHNEEKLEYIKNDIFSATDIEKEDIYDTMSDIIKNTSNYNLMINKILQEKYINFNRILHIPITFELCFGIYNYYIFKKISNKYTINSYKHIDIVNRKKIIIFSGLSESFVQINKLLNLILDSGIDVIFPIYGPSIFSFGNKLTQNVYDYCTNVIDYLNLNKITEIDILAWSLGGVKYLCFDEILKTKNLKSNNIEIKYVYLFEPLLTIRSILDVYVSHNRSIFKTIHTLNKRTINLSTKYKFYNILMSYILHSHLVISAANSSHFLYHAEYKKQITNTIDNNRYLFLSESDFLCNKKSDKTVIENKFNSNNIFIRKGFHGGFLKSDKLNKIFIPLLLKNLNRRL